jgi:hypothetical protein
MVKQEHIRIPSIPGSQIRLDVDKSRVLVTNIGYQYLILSMGISFSPEMFQEKMSDLMQHLNFVRTCLDDLLAISCSTFEDYLEKWNVF